MHTRDLTVLAFAAVVVLACDRDAEAPSGTPPTKPASAPATKSDEAPTGTPAPAPSDPPPASAAVQSDAGAPAPSAPPSREWLLWYAKGDGWVTRWIGEFEGRTATVAQRNALVHTTGAEVFEIVRRDVATPIQTCACLDPDTTAEGKCATTGSVMMPGLTARNLATDKKRPIVAPSGETTMGEIYDISLAIVGGVDGTLVVRTADAGYYCGAHQLIGTSHALHDLRQDKAAAWPEVALPRSLKETAARWSYDKDSEPMFDRFDACDGELTFEAFVGGDTMAWDSLAVALKDGVPQLTWGFGAAVPYVCSVDYLVYGEARTGLIKEAAPLGLAGPLPEALLRGMAELGSKRVVGWGALTLPAADRAEMLREFSEVAQAPWPAPTAVVTETKPAEHAGHAKARLEEGRALTRAKDYRAAITALDAAIIEDPTMGRAWAARGYAKLLDGQLPGAQADCERALTLVDSPRFKASVHYNLGLIAGKQGRNAAAKKAYEASLALRPNKVVQEALDAL